MAGASRPKTRSVTDHWMVGQEDPVLPVGVLPTRRDILKEVLYKRNLPENRTLNQMSLVRCNFLQFESKCYQDDGCSTKSDNQKCTLFKIKWRYEEAAVATIADRTITTNIVDLYKNYLTIKKKKSQTSKGAVEARNSFEASLDSLFDVTRTDAEELIRSDSSRSRQRKKEDLAFLQDQKKDRKQGMSSIDHKHVKIMKNKEKREARVAVQVKKEKARVEKESEFVNLSGDSSGPGVNTTNTDKSMESIKELITPSMSRKRRRSRSGEARRILLEVPENILEQTQQIALAKGISPEAHLDLIAAVITASDGDVGDFKLSRATGYRTREKVADVVTEKDKNYFWKICQDKSKKLIVYFDGKLVDELDPKKVHKEKMDWVAMLVRSPDLTQREQLLGIPEMKSGTGKQ